MHKGDLDSEEISKRIISVKLLNLEEKTKIGHYYIIPRGAIRSFSRVLLGVSLGF